MVRGSHTLHTLAHLSDPHLTSLEGVDARSLMNKRLFGYLSWRRRRRRVHQTTVLDAVTADIAVHAPEQILVSGDLTHVGLPQECRAAARWLAGVADPSRLRLVPGNHDRYVNAPWDDTLGHWSAYLERPGAPAWPRTWSQGDVCVIGIDCATPSGLFMATGTVGEAQIEGLGEALRAAAARGQFRLVMLHHSPLPDGHVWRKRLTDAAQLIRVIQAHGAELIVHGHGHQEAAAQIAWGSRRCHVLSVPSASYAVSGRAGWNLLGIARGEGTWRIDVTARRWVEGAMTTAWHRTLATSGI